MGPIAVSVLVCVVWTIWAAGQVRREPVGGLVYVGQQFLDQGKGSSATIDDEHVVATGRDGYDGQFFYYMALDPVAASAYMDAPNYRYGRILYPLAARALAAGRPALVPWTLLFVNLVAVVGGTFALALLLQRRGASPAYALLFGFAPGLYVAVARDLSEPLAYALVLAALAAWWWDERPRPWLAGALLGLAGLTRETTLLFALALAIAALIGLDDGLGGRRGRDRRAALVLGAMAFVPYVALRLGLLAWLGSAGSTPEAARFPLVPFAGLLSHWPLNRLLLEQAWTIVLAALLAVGLVAWTTRRLGPSLLALVLNVAVLVVFLPAPSYESIVASGRITLGVTCAFLACLPVVPVALRAQVALGVAVLGMASVV